MARNSSRYKELEKPIIFIGNPRSGTSVISEIVMRHKHLGFASRFQDKYPGNLKLNYFRRILDNGLWRIHGQKKQLNKVSLLNRIAFKTGENYPMWEQIVDSNINFRREFLLNTKASEENKEYIRDYFGKIVSYQGKKRLAFKITGPSRIEFLNSIFPDARFIRIHRKPIPTISSLLKSDFWEKRGKKKLFWKGKGAYSKDELQWAEAHKNDPVAITAFQIKRVTDLTDHEIDKTGVDVFNVQYGDFILEPEKTIEAILNFTGLSIDTACMSYFKKNKIYNRNKKDEEYFNERDLQTIKEIFAEDSSVVKSLR